MMVPVIDDMGTVLHQVMMLGLRCTVYRGDLETGSAEEFESGVARRWEQAFHLAITPIGPAYLADAPPYEVITARP